MGVGLRHFINLEKKTELVYSMSILNECHALKGQQLKWTSNSPSSDFDKLIQVDIHPVIYILGYTT